MYNNYRILVLLLEILRVPHQGSYYWCNQLNPYPNFTLVKPYLEAGQTFAIKSLELHCFTGIIPKSVRSQHIQDNISITEFELSAYNMESLNLINSDTHFCWDPTGVKW